MLKILTVVGARPQFIKAAPVSRAIKDCVEINEVLVHTGQHYDVAMSGIFFHELGLEEPRYNLKISGGSHASMTGRQMIEVEKVILKETPDYVLVYGDTNSTLAASLSAAKLNVPIIHIEAGLRSWNRSMPEEVNRLVTDHLSNLLYAPSENAANNLMKEGIDATSIRNFGDVMYDAVKLFTRIAKQKSTILERTDIGRPFAIATCHRAENTDNPTRLGNIIMALAETGDDLSVLLPLHPRTRKAIRVNKIDVPESVILIEPVSYLDMLNLLDSCALVITDSGGLQKEAYFRGKKCVTIRDETEWVELVELNWNIVASPAIKSNITDAINLALEMAPVDGSHPYGDGSAAKKIVMDIAASSAT